MNTIRVTINSKGLVPNVFDVTPFLTTAGITIRNSAGGDFDGGSFQALLRQERKFETFANVTITINGEESTWALAEHSYEKTKSGLYLYSFVFVERARLLENITLSGYCLTQPTDADNEHPNTLASAVYHIIRVAYPRIRPWDAELFGNLLSNLPAVFYERARPPMTRKGQTLYHALAELGGLVGYKLKYINGNYEYVPALPPERDQHPASNFNWASLSKVQSVEQGSHVLADTENALAEDSLIRWPIYWEVSMQSLYAPLKDDSTTKEGFKLELPIYDIPKLFVYSRRIKLRYVREVDAGQNPIWAETYYEMEIELPSSQMLIEKNIYDSLPQADKNKVFYYEQGANVIYASQASYNYFFGDFIYISLVVEQEAAKHNMPVQNYLANYILSLPLFDEQQKNFWYQYPQYDLTIAQSNPESYSFYIQYRTPATLSFKTPKLFIGATPSSETAADNLLTEGAGLNNLKNLATNAFEAAKKLGVENLEGTFYSGGRLPKIGDEVEDYYVTNITSTFKSRLIKSDVVLSKNYPGVTVIPSLNDVARITQTPIEFIERNMVYSEYIIIHREGEDIAQLSKSLLTSDGFRALFAALTSTQHNPEAYLNSWPDKVQVWTYESHANLQNTSHQLPVLSFYTKNSVVFHAKFLDNIASEYIVSDGVVIHKPYTHQGYVDEATFRFFHVNGVENITTLADLGQAQISTPAADNEHLIIDKDPGEQLSITYQISLVSAESDIMPGPALTKYNGFNRDFNALPSGIVIWIRKLFSLEFTLLTSVYIPISTALDIENSSLTISVQAGNNRILCDAWQLRFADFEEPILTVLGGIPLGTSNYIFSARRTTGLSIV